MKRINLLMIAIVAMVSGLTSCDEGLLTSDVQINVTTSEFEYKTNEVYTIDFNVTATDSKIDVVDIRKDGYDFETIEDLDKTANILSFKDSSAVAGTFKYLIVVTDKDDETTEEEVEIIVSNVTTDLEAAASFEWVRIGSADATGLDALGLAWTSNSAEGKVVVKKDATKLVLLDAASWTDITTAEALKEAVDAATGVESYEGISTNQGKDYNEVIATIKDDVYYMINITKSTVVSSDNGTTITITGSYKK